MSEFKVNMSISKEENKMLESICLSEDELCDLQPAFLLLKTCESYSKRLDIGMLKAAHSYIMDISEESSLANCARYTQIDDEIVWYCEPKRIEERLIKLMEKQGEIDAMEFIKELLQIHPFADGNGRIAKLVYYFLTGELKVWDKQSDFIKFLLKIKQ